MLFKYVLHFRFESKKNHTTRLLYSTTGVLLRKVQLDPSLQDLTHIIVDEVHERSVESDFLIIILRRLIRTRANLRVILMSATLDSDKLSAYFSRCPVLQIPGRTFPVDVSTATKYPQTHNTLNELYFVWYSGGFYIYMHSV